MKILPDGTVEIRNKQTGQTKIVSPNDLPSYGIPYTKYADELEAAEQIGIETPTKFKKKPDSATATNLRKEFRQETNDLQFKTIRDAWGRMKNAADTPTGDLSLAYSYIKLLDPNSAVREGELATTEKTRGLSDTVRNSYNKVVKGKRLSPAQRKGFIREGSSIYNVVAKKQKEISTFYSGLAEQGGVDPNDVVGAIGKVEIEKELPFDKNQQQTSQEPSALQRLLPGLGPIPTYAFGTPEQKGVAVAGPLIGAGGLGGGALLKALGGLSSKALAGQRKEVGTKVGTLVTKKAKELGDFYTKEIDPTIKSEWKRIRPSIKDETDANVFLQKLSQWGTKARNPRTGDIKSNATADFYDFLRKSGREIVAEQSPELAQLTDKISFLKQAPRKIGKATWLAAKAGLAAGGLGKILGF